MTPRTPLTRPLIADAAARVADAGGLAAVSMRNVGKQLGVEAMSLYHHVPNKEALLDDLADWVFARIELPAPGQPWRPAMAERAASARSVLARHPWALGLVESRRAPGPALLHHHDSVLGCLRAGGFSVALAAHAFSVIDAYVYGFVLTEQNLPFDDDDDAGTDELMASFLAMAENYPHLAELNATLSRGETYSYAVEFGYGLELILDGLERRMPLG
ncbi:TetR/AcrR family transcriptional regulator [Microterricola pindariensis]|uniref:TetR family transcriptional regulator n=1 Tax=Microterricola pindariensis TaxID=478010 RepID=A0ABX5AXJ2_9MICO|nr:TetR/AcrR family transcriptional regulator [Microterricola pindariensis]PPL19648.1 TetR family transcriptional regulator [Microterricola pindariensis]